MQSGTLDLGTERSLQPEMAFMFSVIGEESLDADLVIALGENPMHCQYHKGRCAHSGAPIVLFDYDGASVESQCG